MFKILRSRVLLFALTLIGWCSQVMYAWGPLTTQDIADINALLPQSAVAGQGLWGVTRSNPPIINPKETLQDHYKERHGITGYHTQILPFFYGVPVAPIPGPPLITAEEIVMANFIATLIPHAVPGAPPPVPVLPAGTVIEVKPKNLSREIRIPIPAGSIQMQEVRAPPIDANFCSIFLPEVLPLPAGTPPGALAPPPANICTIYFRQ